MKKYILPLSKTNTLADCPRAYQNFLTYTSNNWPNAFNDDWIKYLNDELAKYNATFDHVDVPVDNEYPPTKLIFETERDYVMFALRWR